MGLFVKNKKEEPQYYLSATNMKTYNYNVYYMNTFEKVLYFLIAFAVGAAIGYLFYGGLGKNEFNEPTTSTWVLNIIICSITGIVAGMLYLPIRRKQIIAKKRSDLKDQFRELLDALATSVGSGKNIPESFRAAKDDLSVIYPEDSSIINELNIIINGLNNNIDIEVSLQDFGKRSGIKDIVSFADVFETNYRQGGKINEIIKNTQLIITEKMEVEQEIQTVVAGSKNEQLIMTVMPIALIAVIKLMSPEFAENFKTGAGIASTTIAIIMFIIAYFIGNAVLKIKI